ncbi:predicted protein [Histoplasma capsulatum H143]|uniref:Uncharacterized protein n=1 Tax=Ajellomyces capsulatus (strain H143) TaxID=544712 RepID=C6HKM9_AJECH|nr:predicted protein [Histoplasma capsulatum H143]
MTLPKFTNPPPPTQHCLLIFPTPETPLVTLNRPESLNCVNSHGHAELHAVWEWMDAEPLLRVGIITGKGKRLVLGLTSKVVDVDSGKTMAAKAISQPQNGFHAQQKDRLEREIFALSQSSHVSESFTFCYSFLRS